MINFLISFIEKHDLFRCQLYSIRLKDHLLASYALCKSTQCSYDECVLALLHSCYGELYGYKAQGINYNERGFLQKILGCKLENLVFMYNSIQAGEGLHSFKVDGPGLWSINSLFGKVTINNSILSQMSNVYVMETIEQIYYLTDVACLYSYNDLKKHVDKLNMFRAACSKNVNLEIIKINKKIRVITEHAI